MLNLGDDLTKARRGAKLWVAAVAVFLLMSVSFGLWLLRNQHHTRRGAGATEQAMQTMSAEMSQLRKGVTEYPQIEAQVRQMDRGNDPVVFREKVCAELGKQLGVDPKTLHEKLPQFAEQLKSAADASSYTRASAAYVARDFREAERLGTLAANQAREAYPPDNSATIRALELAGWAAQQLGHSSSALGHFRAAEALTDRDREPNIWAGVQHAIALLLFEQGRYSVAESIWRDVAGVRARTIGPEDPETLRSRAGLAMAIEYQGDFAAAEAEDRAIIAIQERLAGPDSPEVLVSRNNLAETLRKQGKNAEAEAESQK